MYVCMYVYICSVQLYKCVCGGGGGGEGGECMFVLYVCLHLYVCICRKVCVYIYGCIVCMYVCLYKCIFAHTFMFPLLLMDECPLAPALGLGDFCT